MSLVGSLLYIAKLTRPDIVWIVSVLSRFMDKPTNTHWLSGKRVLRYLQATKSLKLVYSRDSDFNLHAESDADWSGDHDDRRSTTGYFFKLGLSGGAVSWQTKKQQTVALSLCEAEYQGLVAAVQEATFSCDHSCVKWAMSNHSQPLLGKTIKVASSWQLTLWCTSDQNILTRSFTSYGRKLMTIQFN